MSAQALGLKGRLLKITDYCMFKHFVLCLNIASYTDKMYY
ncbi:hypothetical protein GLYMA_11G044900v4 [Glycine max]|uniref:Uncharacterized protein n=1 Tax=Glycine max TaxID=3847 RepID=A0A0R0HL97_SOYBN|nr:hypothetical protein GYH30_030017 [Glycine max]KRH28312.1 hypothetical protein GLYMA_11G044900v4 [Glycine max]